MDISKYDFVSIVAEKAQQYRQNQDRLDFHYHGLHPWLL
tara:strand:+ start:16270 stop:16386 length:117 start_codon:yes stop_codon:yes gene_type:complete